MCSKMGNSRRKREASASPMGADRTCDTSLPSTRRIPAAAIQLVVDDVVAVVPDLFFQSRISAAARHSGRSVRYLTSERVDREAGGFRLALVDLDAASDIASTIRGLRAAGEGTIVVFGPHVDTEKRKAARAAGADRVLAKSKFVADLPGILAARQGEA